MNVLNKPKTAEQILNEILILIKTGAPNSLEQITRLIEEYHRQFDC